MKEVYNALEKFYEKNKNFLGVKRFKEEIGRLEDEYSDLINILADSVPENIPDRPGAVTLLLMNEIISSHFQGFHCNIDKDRNIFRAIYKELGGEKEVRFEEFR